MFTLHPQLKNDTFFVADLALSRVLLMNDSQFPWLILVPRKDACQEIYDLNPEDRQTLQQESISVGKAIMQEYQGDKLNIAALGNLVPQLHIHHIVRFKHDIAWPAPIWGRQPSVPYSEQDRETQIALLKKLLK